MSRIKFKFFFNFIVLTFFCVSNTYLFAQPPFTYTGPIVNEHEQPAYPDYHDYDVEDATSNHGYVEVTPADNANSDQGYVEIPADVLNIVEDDSISPSPSPPHPRKKPQDVIDKIIRVKAEKKRAEKKEKDQERIQAEEDKEKTDEQLQAEEDKKKADEQEQAEKDQEKTDEQLQAEEDEKIQEEQQASERESQVQEYAAICEASATEARECCSTNAMGCSLGVDVSQDSMQMIQIIAAGGTQVAMSQGTQNPKDMKKLCKMMAMISGISMPMNGFMAYKCNSKKSECQDACSQGVELAKGDSKFASLRIKMESKSRTCESYGHAVNNMAGQAVSAMNALQQARLCDQLVSENNNLIPKTDFPNIDLASTAVDCTDPANASNPICLNCSGDAGKSNPACPGYTVPGEGEASDVGETETASFGGSTGEDSFNVGEGGDDTFAQGSPYGPSNDQPASSSGVGGGGGGGGLGGGSGGSLAGNEGGGGRGSGRGYNTDVLKGERGGGGSAGKGYNQSKAGGFGGYGKGKEKKSKDEKFDLSKFLPGGKKGKAINRRISGIGGLRGQIGTSHESIWKRISTRFIAVCSADRLENCRKFRHKTGL